MAIDVLGAVIEKATLKPLPQAVAELVLNPLDMTDTGFAIVDTRRLVVHYADGKPEPRRMADDDQVSFFDKPVAFSPVRLLDRKAFPSGGAGMAGTAGDVLTFLETLRAGGLLQPQTRSAMFEVQARTRGQAEGPGWDFGFGGAVLVDPKAAGTPQAPGTLQWNGAYGHRWFIDRANAFTVVALTNTAFEGMSAASPPMSATPSTECDPIMTSSTSSAPAAFSSTQLRALRAHVNGRVFVPGDAGYDTARQTWNVATFDQRPAIVVMPSSAADVASAVSFAREHGLSIAAQGGGHGHPHPANDALLVNFASMARVHVTPVAAASDPPGQPGASGLARAEAGAKWSDVIAAAHPYGLAPLNGFSATVGVSGYTLGGGIGWLVRQYGAAAGSLRSAEVVTADGRLLQVDDQNHADLFWGLRGGGGNFGLVTVFEFDLYPVKEIFGGFVVYPIAQGKQALSAYAQWTKTVPDTLTSAVRLVHYPPAPVIPEPLRGASAIVIMACYTGSTVEGEALVRPLRSIGTPLLDTFRPMPYAEIATVASDPPEAPPLFIFTNGGGLRDMSSDVIDALLRIAGDRAAGIFMVEARHLGGALARQPEDAMPFSFRSPSAMTALAAAPTPQALDGGKRSVAALLEALRPSLTGELLINSLDAGNTGPRLTRAAYSEKNYRKLVALKDTYDSANVFRFNHNIAPSNGAATT
jgi:hypothetical protein